MAMTLQELEKIHDVILWREFAAMDDVLEIVTREIRQMEQDEILSESKANPA